MYTDYDVIIIGSGCAGLAAALYTSRAGLRTLILERETMGGELMNRQLIENYPGFAAGVEGPELGSAMLDQATSFGAEIEFGDVTGIKDKGEFKIVKTADQSRTCKGVIIASGAHPRKLGVPGEEEFAGRGVFYCATCDGPQYAGKAVVVAGAGDSGVTEGLYLERLGCTVTIVELLPQPKASQVLLDRANASPKIEIRCGTKIEAIVGDDSVSGVDIQDAATGAKDRLAVEGVLVRIGLIPNTEFVRDTLALTPAGQIPVNENMETAMAGVFAVGDVRQHSPMQMATAVGDGVTAAMALGRHIASL
ncbi:MAG TPA: FAD-dependent oxidoreductase [Anaerolineae bacterium]|nr:FAD-dependent oxidoreductase [Anaerolineae bacterium]HOQ98049.1 FAD-dependent oxidoreductase [Anaerolineae bacterium]HPL27844.1 FAD-dependent oxidoreductase [Anaerolineae bacterium]